MPPLAIILIKPKRQILQRKISLRIIRRLHPTPLPLAPHTQPIA
jgi:hypothetical protein